jgi:hypothetical protein
VVYDSHLHTPNTHTKSLSRPLVYDSIGLAGQYQFATCWSLSLAYLRLR